MSQQGSLGGGGSVSGNTVQWLQTSTGALIDATGVMPFDDTIPVQTDGTQILTLTITPTEATNRLFITFVASFAAERPASITVAGAALYQDATVNALAVGYLGAQEGAFTDRSSAPLTYSMIAGTTSATTFKIRAGVFQAGDHCYVNGYIGARVFGGFSSTTFTIMEVEV